MNPLVRAILSIVLQAQLLYVFRCVIEIRLDLNWRRLWYFCRRKVFLRFCKQALAQLRKETAGDSASGFASSVSGGRNRTAPENFNWAAGNLLEKN